MSNYYLGPDGNLYAKDELRHYGVKGMKWGVRRYQNPDGTLTAAGRKRARQEYKTDNTTAFELGKNATISGHSAAKSMQRTIRLENKLDKQYARDPEGVKRRTKSLNDKWTASAKTTEELTKYYQEQKAKAEAHYKSLVDKYGQEAVSSIKHKDIKMPKGEHSPDSFKTMNERTNQWTDYLRTAGMTLTSAGFSALLGCPVSMVWYPRSTRSKASISEEIAYNANLSDVKKKRKALRDQ